MKKRPVSALENCWLSVMLPAAATTAPLTACTMPGRSGQTRVRTQWVLPVTALTVSTALLHPEDAGASPGAFSVILL
jgi:hypothetical protein